MDNIHPRHLASQITEALQDSPVVLLNGARQTGKTTLALELINDAQQHYISLDDAVTLAAARSDAAGFLEGLMAARVNENTPLVIDEVQHAPELFPAIKLIVDRARRRKEAVAGRFLLTGSANVLLLPKLSESLAGRMEVLTLWPLSQAEIAGGHGDFIDRLFAPTFSPVLPNSDDGGTLYQRVLHGGYPEALARSSDKRRKAWFDSYLTSILQRDVRDLSNIENLTAMPRLLQLLAARTAGILNLADVSRAVALPYATLHRYMSLLETTFLIIQLPAWSHRLSTRLVKAPKLLLSDTGLAAALLGLDEARLQHEPLTRGALLENFVAMEIIKQAGPSQSQPKPFHFRTQNGREVDLVLETSDGRIVGLETKASATVTADDFKGLRHLAEVTQDKFVRGVVLYSGDKVVPFGGNMFAVPIAALWGKE